MDESSPNEMLYEGLEIGAVSVKWVGRSGNGLVQKEILSHGGDPKKILKTILSRNRKTGAKIVATGQAAQELVDLPYRSETECFEKALDHYGLQPDMLLSLGGETFSVYPMKDGRVKNIISSSKCAAGTGEFIVQQFKRMGLTLEQGISASHDGQQIQLATRCSVHCKSDATHKLNKGECTPGDISKSLIHDLAKKVSEMVELAQWPTRSIVLAGGVTQNNLFVENFKSYFKNSDITVLPESPCLEAFGASFFAEEGERKNDPFLLSGSGFETLPPLRNAESLLDYRVQPNREKSVIENGSYILGVDAGSTTTKAVLFNTDNGTVDASCYLRTLGNPIEATKKCLNELIRQTEEKPIRIIQTGVTGSGREMVSVYLDNCLSFNEILAHARAAAQEVPGVDTVFEIGGQDSKFISFLEGIPIDYAMNEGCSAGTGSFLEESASVDMGVDVRDISPIAEDSDTPIAFGERCAAFINTDLRNALQQGANKEDVIAGLVYSIADNYISRIVGPRHVGENLLFQGGVALNRSAALAMAARTRRTVVVPPHPELMGSIGTALMARDLLIRKDAEEQSYNLKTLVKGEMTVKGSFACKACDNICEIKKISIREKTYPFGGLCSKYEMQRHGNASQKEGRDLVTLRNKLMFEDFGPTAVDHPKGAIGLPMALTTFELFPFYAKLINALGYEVVLSQPSKAGNTKTAAAICYPCEIVHGAVYDLLSRNVDYILLPYVINLNIPDSCNYSYTCPSTTLIPDLIRSVFKRDRNKILAPHIGLSDASIRTTLDEIGKIGAILQQLPEDARAAGETAWTHYQKFLEAYRDTAIKELEAIRSQPSVIIAGRPYSTCAAEVNLALPRKITSRGYHAIPADMLPWLNNATPRDNWHFTQQISNAVTHVNRTPHWYICLVSCFSCGPDSVMYHAFRQNLSGHTFCYLEIDSHTAHAGFDTRVGAFLDIVEERNRTSGALSQGAGK